MSDPLSALSNEEEDADIEKEFVDEDFEISSKSQETVSRLDKSSSHPHSQFQDDTDGGISDKTDSVEHGSFQIDLNDQDESTACHSPTAKLTKELSLDEDSNAIHSPRPTSTDTDLSLESDLLAQIEEEMNSGPKDFDVLVEDPEKVVKTMESYVAFTVKTKTTRSDFESAEYCVKRRYNDFLWLRKQLVDQHPQLIIPPLPEKHSLTIDRFEKEFVRFREVALHRFTSKLAQHPVISQDQHLKAFLTLEYDDFQSFKKKGSGLLSRMTRSITTMGGSFMLKNRSEEHTKMHDYATGLGDRMGACERITVRLMSEQNDYLTSTGGSIGLYQNWQTAERQKLAENLGSFSELMETCHSAYKSMVDQSTLKLLLPYKEYALYADVMKSSLYRRDALQHELEILAEELVKANDELQQLESGQTGGGFLGRNSTEEAIQQRKDKVKSKISELDSAHAHCKEKLEERNKQLSLEMERWHLNKKADMKEAIGGLADRTIHAYDKQIDALEETLHKLKECLVSD